MKRWLLALAVWIAALGAGIAWYLSTPAELARRTKELSEVPVGRKSDEGAAPHALDPVLAMARRSLALHRQRDRDYTARLSKRLRFGTKLSEPEVMDLKLRSRERPAGSEGEMEPRPIDVYLGFLEPKSLAGREVIWRQGFNDDCMVVHETGLLNVARVQLAPTGRLAMMGNRYPISDIGIERLLLKLIEIGIRDRILGECEVSIQEDVESAGRRCRRIEVIHPQKTVEIEGQPYDFLFHRAEIDMDVEYELPIHYASYLWPERQGGEPLLDEEFTYRELRLNCNLTDVDFDPDNSEYRYPSR